MAVSFINNQDGNKFLIGGQASLTGATNGHAGPMPTYDISREDVTLGDGTHVSFRYTITVVGVATNGIQDVQTKGAGQGAVINLSKQGLETLNAVNFGNYGVGKLEIAPYGGYADIISFNDARLVSVDMAEQDEETAGTQYQNYTYTFEAYTNTSEGGSSEPTWNLKEASEAWSLSETDNFTYDPDLVDISNDNNKYRVYTLTHTLSAQGYRKYSGTGVEADGHAWRQASKWVSDRLAVSEGLTAISQDLMGDTEELETSFHPRVMNAPGDTKLVDLISNGYQLANKNRVLDSNIGEGRYSVTDTYTLIKGAVKAFSTVETSIDSSAGSTDPIRVTVNGSIIGISTQDFGAKSNVDKYNNALTEYNRIWEKQGGGAPINPKDSQAGKIANNLYIIFTNNQPPGYITGQLFKYPVAFDESHNRVNGTIDWSVTFSDYREDVNFTGVYSEKMTSAYTNYDTLELKPNPISVVARGPYLYLPDTTDEKTATFTLELKMLKNARTQKPNGKNRLINKYGVEGRCVYKLHKPQITSLTESWNPSTGVYTITMTYTYV